MVHVMRVMTKEDGDKKTTWTPSNMVEVEAAQREFDYLVTEKKYSAFAVKPNGDAGERLTKFNPAIGAMILIPPIVGG